MPTTKHTAIEEDLLALLAERVYNLVNTYVESQEGVGLLVSQEELQGLAADLVTKAVEGVVDENTQLEQAMQWALQKYRRTGEGRVGPHRQYAVALINAVYDYIGQDRELDDEELDRKVIEEIENLGVDYDKLNTLINSIY